MMHECPSCYLRHNANNYFEICKSCIKKYPMLNSSGENISFHFVNANDGLYCKNEKTGILIFDERVCYINDIKCFVSDKHGDVIFNLFEK